jgi:2-polyprenyl-3-methyl-5-hydroxy-6-metoxy-1,4-benzoquinol methylase
MKHVICDFCGSDQPRLRFVLRDARPEQAGQYNLVECERCGLLYLDPQPTWEELELQYTPSQSGEKYRCFIEAPQDQHPFLRWAQEFGLRRRCRYVTRHIQHGRLLDVGCATGSFLNAMQGLGDWKVAGVEPVASAAQYARDRFGLDVYNGILLDAGYADRSFDVVTLWDVIEHVDRPLAYIREIYRILSPGGWLVLKTPDPTGGEARLFGANWRGYVAPQHLYGFPREVLFHKLAETGFELVHVSQTGGDYATFMISLATSAFSQGHKRLYHFLYRMGTSTVGRVASTPLFYAQRWVGLRSSATYFAQKAG